VLREFGSVSRTRFLAGADKRREVERRKGTAALAATYYNIVF
jgi:hypothetical protein